MGLFNYLMVNAICPRCGVEAEMETEFRFGLKDLTRYLIGDQLRWDGIGIKTPETRPEGGNYDAEAYVVCPHCDRDFWLIVSIKEDIIASAVINTTRRLYISDEFSPQQQEQVNSLEPTGSILHERRMEPVIVVRRHPYEEPYHTQLEFVISNGLFTGSTDIFCSVTDLTSIGAALRKFPDKIGDEFRYEYGSESPEVRFYRYFLLRAYTANSTGHCAIQFRINQNSAEPNEGICQFFSTESTDLPPITMGRSSGLCRNLD
jgi:hypothetical protein